MPVPCKVPWCKATQGKTWASFHRFPKLISRRNLWCQAIGIDPTLVMNKSSRICPNHFSADQFTSVHKIALTRSAVPYLTNPGLIELETGRVAQELSGNSASPSTLSSASQSSHSYYAMSNNVMQPKNGLCNMKNSVLASSKIDMEVSGGKVAHELSGNSASTSTLPSAAKPLVSILSTSPPSADEPLDVSIHGPGTRFRAIQPKWSCHARFLLLRIMFLCSSLQKLIPHLHHFIFSFMLRNINKVYFGQFIKPRVSAEDDKHEVVLPYNSAAASPASVPAVFF